MTYPWEAYVTIDRSLSEEDSAALVTSLNQIWNFHDGEGRALLVQARRQNHDQPVHISRDTGDYGSGVFVRLVGGQEIDAIRINFRTERMRTVEEDGLGRRASLTSTLVHELYHVADDPRDIERAAENTLLQLAGVERDSPSGRRLLAAIDAQMREEGLDRTQTIITSIMGPGYLMEHGVNTQAAIIGFVPELERVQALRDAGVISREQPDAEIIANGNAIPRNEEDATDFTDALLQKNTPDEPLRATYANNDMIGRMPRDFATYRQSDTPAQSPGFTAVPYNVAGLGEIEPPPQVRPVIATEESRQK